MKPIKPLKVLLSGIVSAAIAHTIILISAYSEYWAIRWLIIYVCCSMLVCFIQCAIVRRLVISKTADSKELREWLCYYASLIFATPLLMLFLILFVTYIFRIPGGETGANWFLNHIVLFVTLLPFCGAAAALFFLLWLWLRRR